MNGGECLCHGTHQTAKIAVALYISLAGGIIIVSGQKAVQAKPHYVCMTFCQKPILMTVQAIYLYRAVDYCNFSHSVVMIIIPNWYQFQSHGRGHNSPRPGLLLLCLLKVLHYQILNLSKHERTSTKIKTWYFLFFKAVCEASPVLFAMRLLPSPMKRY